MQLGTEVIVAIAKGLKAKLVKEASADLSVGTHQIDALVRVTGQIKKGEDVEQIVHMKVPHWAIIAVLMSKVNGVTLDAVVREALSLPEEQVTAVKKQAAEAIDTVKAPAKSMTAGRVTTKLTFDLLTGQKAEKEVEQEGAEEVPA